MSPRRRVLLLLTALAVIAAPAVALRAACAGKSCPEPLPPAEPPAFCTLSEDSRALIAAGFRDARSPDVLAFGRMAAGSDGDGGSVDPAPTRVPLVFVGAGVRRGQLPDGVTLDRVVPTLEEAGGIRRPHPEARTGTALPGVLRPASRSPLLVVIAWEGVGSEELRAGPSSWPRLRSLAREGAGTMEASTGSLPVDPAAVLSTIGSGALPSHHGVTGTLVRAADGTVVPAWSEQAPLPVIAFLGDDLDELSRQRSRIGLVGDDQSDRGLIGGTWYLDHDRDDVVRTGRPASAVGHLLGSGYGALDGATDLLGVALEGETRTLDRTTAAIVRRVQQQVTDAVVVITATGDAASESVPSSEVVAAMERGLNAPSVVAAVGTSGVFLDRDVAAASTISAPVASQALAREARGMGIDVVAFPGYAVTLRRFC